MNDTEMLINLDLKASAYSGGLSRVLLKLVLFIIVFCVQLSSITPAHALTVKKSAPSMSWTKWARRVGQSESERAEAIKKLKSDPDLETMLTTALDGHDRALALDVISALGLENLLPTLLKRVIYDQDGFTTLTINSLLSDKNRDEILAVYKAHLSKSTESTPVGPASSPDQSRGGYKLSAANIVAMLEPLGRLGHELAKERIANLLTWSSPEIRSAALSYIRSVALDHHNHTYDTLIRPLLRASEFQLRLQAVSLLNELRKAPDTLLHIAGDELENQCSREGDEKARLYCRSLLRPLADESAEISPAMGHKALKRSLRAKPELSCAAITSRIAAQGTLKVRVVFGYKDTRPARFVGDRHERLAFIQRILKPCATGADCGFTRSPKNADLFTKTIPNRSGLNFAHSKTGMSVRADSGSSVKVSLWVVHSSEGSDDQANRSDPMQEWRSRYSQAAFQTGLSDADVVFYNGHSRFGGGPDFAPPHLGLNNHIDANYYTSQQPGITRLLSAIENSKASRAKILGLYSCSSEQHFTSAISNVANLRILASEKLVYYADAIEDSLRNLSSLLKWQCPGEPHLSKQQKLKKT